MKTKAEIAQEIFEFNRQHAGSGRFSYSEDREVMAIYEDLCFEQAERDRQRRSRRQRQTLMLIALDSGDKSFGMQELIER